MASQKGGTNNSSLNIIKLPKFFYYSYNIIINILDNYIYISSLFFGFYLGKNKIKFINTLKNKNENNL